VRARNARLNERLAGCRGTGTGAGGAGEQGSREARGVLVDAA